MALNTDIPYELIQQEMISVAKEAGKLMLKHAGTVDADDKTNAVDLVTFVDKKVESIVKATLGAKFPDYKFIGEESSAGVAIPKGPCFIVDPVDGTTDFYHNFPFFCISLGFTVGGEPLVGVVYNPSLDQLFTGIKGKGAYLNGALIPKVKKPLSLQKSLIAFEAGGVRSGNNFETRMTLYKNLLAEQGGFIHGFRSFGSAAMNLCYTALGAIDGYFDLCYAWDVCAGWVILGETGGFIIDSNKGGFGKKIPVDNNRYLAVRGAASEAEQKEWVETFYSYLDGGEFDRLT